MSRKFQIDSAIMADIQTANADSYIDNLKMLDIELIEPNEGNFYELSEIETLAEDIERQGLMTALVVSENGGRYKLISGHRRLSAVKLLIESGRRKSSKVPCFIKGAKPNNETQLDLIMLNATQRKYSDADKMREYEELTRIFKELEAAGKPIKGRIRDRIADALNVSSAQVGKLDNIKHNAIPDVEQAVKSGDMSISTANEVAKLPPEKQQKIISEKPKITHKEVKEMQREESVSTDEDVEIPDDDEDEDDTNEEETDGYTAVTLTVTEAETLSRYMDALLVRVMGDDYDVLRSLADRLTQ
ncbi:MAG: ParB N-terminal domain-containing protein [Oscillospiraceae bacterium]|nr:ParB N-terminal domain-containing protein [Oscillospiraceae bacterium]